MKSITRKDFLRGFASLVVYSAPAVVALAPLGCAGGSGTVQDPDGTGSSAGTGQPGTNCSTSGTSVSCDSLSTSYTESNGCSAPGSSVSC